MTNSRISAALIMGLLLLFAAPSLAQENAGELAGLVLEDVNGEELHLADYAGKDVLVISFWATYCKPCKTEMPFLQELHERYGGKGLKVVGVSLDTPETESMVGPFLAKNHYTYTVAVDRQSDITNVLNPKTTLPHLVIYDRSGRKVLAKDGFTPGDRPGLEAKIKRLLNKGVGSDPAAGAETADPGAAGELSGLVLEDVRGEELSLEDYVGRDVLVISFWATYCKPCKTEMPFLQELHERYGAKGLKVVGVSLDTPETESMVGPFLAKNHYTYTVAVDRQSEVTNVLNPKTTLPHLVIYDRSGRKVLAKDGFTPGDRPGLEAKITKLLAAPAGATTTSAPPKIKGKIDWAGLARDFRYDITNSLYVEWHQDNHNNQTWDDDFVSIKDRLNVRLGTRGFTIGGRFDGSHFISLDDSAFPQDKGGALRSFGDFYPYDYRLEKIFAKLRGRSATLELGDFYVCLGKGMTACIQKLDELAIDTTLRGAKGTVRTELFEAIAFSGVSNIVNVGDQTQVKLPDPNDWLSGASLKTRFIPFVNLGVLGSFLKDDVDYGSLAGGTARKHLWSVGGLVEAPRILWGHAAVVSEFDWFHHENVSYRHDEKSYLAGFDESGDDGFAWYTAISGHVSIVGALLEIKWYEGLSGFGSLSKEVARDLGSYQVKSKEIPYHNLPPLEDEELFLRPSYYDALGFRGHLDVAVPGTGMIWYVNYAHHDETNKGGQDFGKNDSWVRHVYGGVQLRYDRLGINGNVQGGWRRDKENAESIHDYTMWHAGGDLTFPIWRRLSMEVSGRYESYQQKEGSFEPDFSIAQTNATLNISPWVSIAGMYEYSDQPPVFAPNYKHHIAGAVTYRFMSGSWVRVFYGSTRGGLKCSGGVCRVFPPFNGLKTEVTVRF